MHFMIDFENVFWGCETLRCGASALSAVLIVLCKVLGQAYLDGQFIKLIESIASHKLSVSRTSRRLVGGLLSLLTLQMLLIVVESCKGRETELWRERERGEYRGDPRFVSLFLELLFFLSLQPKSRNWKYMLIISPHNECNNNNNHLHSLSETKPINFNW